MTDSEKNDFQKALNKAADILARRSHSEKELRDKLKKYFDPEQMDLILDAVIAEVWKRKWLLPPEELAEAAARSWSQAGKSAEYIAEQLRKRGLPEVELEAEDEIEKMKILLKKKFKDWEETQSVLNYEERTKAYRYLKYRGFDDALIRKVIHEES